MRQFKYQIILIIAILAGFLVIKSLINTFYKTEEQKLIDQLNKVHNDALLKAKSGIEVYATLVSSFRSYIENSKKFPSELELQNYTKDLLKDLKFEDSLIVSYLDKDHVFKYVITPNEIDPFNLKGLSTKDLRNKEEIDRLNHLMSQDSIILFPPINLIEGWAGFPFNFSAKDYNDDVVGYIAPIIDVKYLLNKFYDNDRDSKFVHQFIVNDSIDISREVVYDNTQIYNKNRDSEFYKNFDLNKKDFIYSSINLYGLNFKIGSAYKKKPQIDKTIVSLSYLWYSLLAIFSMLLLYQFSKNLALNSKLKTANKEIELKNATLEKSLLKTQTLIKEIHHRVKNNMQMISGLLMLQEDEYADEKVIKALEQSRNRIQSMALVHEKLYDSVNLIDIEAKEYTKQLIRFVEDTIGNSKLNVIKELNIPPNLIFDADTTANLGLIINELVTNSFKHAFSIGVKNKITISIIEEQDHFKLIYKDNGKGIPKEFNFKESNSLGLKLIYILSDELKGNIYYDNAIETYVINFKPMLKSFKD